MINSSMIFIGLDTHKELTEVAYVEDDRNTKIVHLGRVLSTKLSIKKLARQFQSKNSNARLHFVYEAGPCGYWIYRLLTCIRHPYYIVAPSLIPKQSGKQVKSD